MTLKEIVWFHFIKNYSDRAKFVIPALQSNILEIFYINSLINQDAFSVVKLRQVLYYNFIRTPSLIKIFWRIPTSQ